MWVIGPSARGARKMFGRPVGSEGEVDVSGVAPGDLRRLQGEGVLLYVPDETAPLLSELRRDVSLLLERVASLESSLASALARIPDEEEACPVARTASGRAAHVNGRSAN